MSEPRFPVPVASQRDERSSKTGEGAQTALAAMIRKRRMGENHVERDPPDTPERQSAPDA